MAKPLTRPQSSSYNTRQRKGCARGRGAGDDGKGEEKKSFAFSLPFSPSPISPCALLARCMKTTGDESRYGLPLLAHSAARDLRPLARCYQTRKTRSPKREPARRLVALIRISKNVTVAVSRKAAIVQLLQIVSELDSSCIWMCFTLATPGHPKTRNQKSRIRNPENKIRKTKENKFFKSGILRCIVCSCTNKVPSKINARIVKNCLIIEILAAVITGGLWL